MTRWGIKKRVLFLALAPALLTALVLVSYFALVRFVGVENEQRAHALSLARQFAMRAAAAVQFSDQMQLEQQARMLLLEDEVHRVTVTDQSGVQLVQWSNGAPAQSDAAVMASWPIETQRLAQRRSSSDPDAAAAPVVLGKVSVEVSRHAALQRLWRELALLIGLWMVCLSATTALALRLGKEITLPIGRLAKAVDGLAAGDLDTRIPVDSGGEFAKLESGINDMAARLKASQENLQRRVNDATANLLAQKEEAERANLANIAVPVLCLAGENDPNAPPAGVERMAGKIAGVRYVCLPGVGHLPNLEAPAAFDAAILNFLRQALAQ